MINDHEGRIRVIHSCSQQPCPLMEALQTWRYRLILASQAEGNPYVLAVLLVTDDARLAILQPSSDCVEAAARLLASSMDLHGNPPAQA